MKYKQDMRSLTFEQRNIVGVFEEWNGTGVNSQFDELRTELGRVPSLEEFIEETLPLVERNWELHLQEAKPFPFGVNKDMERAVKERMLYRLERNYLSFRMEVDAVEILKKRFPKAEIITDKYLDIIMGVDIVMIESGEIYYFHITKDSSWARESIKRKEKKQWFKVNGEWRKWKRDFSGHLIWTYDDELRNVDEVIGEQGQYLESVYSVNTAYKFRNWLVKWGVYGEDFVFERE